MKKLWAAIENKNWRMEAKYRAVLVLFSILFALAGLIVWAIIRGFVASSLSWLICLVGYPVVLSWLVVFFYACNHEFHDGRKI